MTLPSLHVRPPLGWLNDPNGPIHWRGRYHLFFQYNPDSHRHNRICWGHVSSTDLVRWRDEGVALRPSDRGPDAAGCWSGCIVADGDRAVAVYTGSAPQQNVCLAFADDDDLRSWTKHPVPVAESPFGADFRDPFVFSCNGHRYAVVAGRDDGGPVLWLYGCEDLLDWTPLGTLLDRGDPVTAQIAEAGFWECPQLFTVDGTWVLILSLLNGDEPGRVVYLVGDLRPAGSGLRFEGRTGGLVDHGHDFYAPVVLPDDGGALLWGWSWEDRAEPAVEADGWAGVLTVARRLSLTSDDRLISSPVSELASRHDGPRELTLDGLHRSAELPPGPVNLLVEIHPGTTGKATVSISGGLTIHLDHHAGTITVTKEVHVGYRRDWPTTAPLPAQGSTQLRILIDGSIVEIFLRDGACFTDRLYLTAPATLLLDGDAEAHGVGGSARERLG